MLLSPPLRWTICLPARNPVPLAPGDTYRTTSSMLDSVAKDSFPKRDTRRRFRQSISPSSSVGPGSKLLMPVTRPRNPGWRADVKSGAWVTRATETHADGEKPTTTKLWSTGSSAKSHTVAHNHNRREHWNIISGSSGDGRKKGGGHLLPGVKTRTQPDIGNRCAAVQLTHSPTQSSF